MNQEKIGNRIKEIRIKNNLTQQQFALKYGVTYQAVSKWENGKNIPDIAILKEICKDYQLDLEELLEVAKSKKEKRYKYLWIIPFIVLLVVFLLILIKNVTSNDFEFRTFSSSCDNFQVSGSLAYNDKKSTIYISNISYCGEISKEKYQEIECTLYETNNNTKTKISSYNYQQKELVSLEDFLKKVNFHIDDYNKTCKNYSENTFHLEIDVISKEGKRMSYKVPLKLDKSCKK